MLDLQQASTLGDLELIRLLDFEPEIPCQIAPGSRVIWCQTTSDHPATCVVLSQCGCLHFYCNTGWMVWKDDDYVLCRCGTQCGMVTLLPLS